ncbi:hypothetical protein K435DRAFT_808482 [Dendrothele bispora CBS 962.96]|uniref:Uncharacterized protein n=1 Tax=Dendrothele bispora (strain CBS 962.96) TaxID=1314807 RepID=A0A4S8L1B5_DENBC|nr:hypothetical protein K435DRAFT_808482 [Dendrothele bispora CBS 962.96]
MYLTRARVPKHTKQRVREWTRMEKRGLLVVDSSVVSGICFFLRARTHLSRLPHYQNNFIMQFSKSLFAEFTPILALFALGAVLVAQVNGSALPATPGDIEARDRDENFNSLYTSFFYIGIPFEKIKKKMGLVGNELQKSATGRKKNYGHSRLWEHCLRHQASKLRKWHEIKDTKRR